MGKRWGTLYFVAIVIVLILVIGLTIVLALRKTGLLEPLTGRTGGRLITVNKLADTSKNSLNYKWCIGMSDDEFTIETRFENCPFYVAKFHQPISDLSEVESVIIKELTDLQKLGPIGPTGVLMAVSSDNQYSIYLLFPNFTKEKKPILRDLEAISKNHRWFYTLLYTDAYTSSELCSDKQFHQCAGIPIEEERYSQAVGSLLIKTDFVTLKEAKTGKTIQVPYSEYVDDIVTSDVVGASTRYYNSFLYRYITPCGTEIAATPEANDMVSIFPKQKFYAFYQLNLSHPKFSSFWSSVSPFPNLSMLTEREAMRYGCGTQLVSENHKFVLLLEEDGASRGLRLYELTAPTPQATQELYDSCRTNGKLGPNKRLVWNIPLSKEYASFKVLDNRIVLVDYDIIIWAIEVTIRNTPIVLKLEDNGSLRIYDDDDNIVQEYSKEEVAQIETSQALSAKFVVNNTAIQQNRIAEEQRIEAEKAAEIKRQEEIALQEQAEKVLAEQVRQEAEQKKQMEQATLQKVQYETEEAQRCEAEVVCPK